MMKTNLTVLLIPGLLFLPGCGTKTDEVPRASVYADFNVAITAYVDYDDSGDLTSERFMEVSGGLYSYDEKHDANYLLELQPGERLVLSDGADEFDLLFNGGPFSNPNAPYGYYLWAWEGEDGVDMNATQFVLRYYRFDGAVLESRVSRHRHAKLLEPMPGTAWNPSLQTLRVAWEAADTPVSELHIRPHCVRLALEDSDIDYITIDVHGLTEYLIDIRDENFDLDCGFQSGWLAVVAESQGDSDPAYHKQARFTLLLRTEMSFYENYGEHGWSPRIDRSAAALPRKSIPHFVSRILAAFRSARAFPTATPR